MGTGGSRSTNSELGTRNSELGTRNLELGTRELFSNPPMWLRASWLTAALEVANPRGERLASFLSGGVPSVRRQKQASFEQAKNKQASQAKQSKQGAA
eukprot:scaffold4832_cov239-Pinguiococcus_pyrenoidosus.AAC.2